MTLYTCANDKEPGESACDGPGTEDWPPFRPEATAPAPHAPLSIITRDDGSKQYAFKGKPLYPGRTETPDVGASILLSFAKTPSGGPQVDLSALIRRHCPP